MNRITKVTEKIEPLDSVLMEEAQKRLDNLTKPLGSLGRLESIAKQAVGITRSLNPPYRNKVIFTLAADHGVTAEGVSAFPKEVTAQMVYNFLRGGAGINVLAKHAGARVVIADLGVAIELTPDPKLIIKKVNYGTRNMAQGAAMTRDEALRSIEAGMEICIDECARGLDIAGTGEMGIGNTTAATAITACFTKKPIEVLTGRGAGLDDAGLKNKIRIIEKAISVNKPDASDPLDVLMKVGGYEIGGLAGIILAAASKKIPVVIDGFISGSAALIAYYIEPKVREYLIAGHCSVESGHAYILEHLGLKPVLDLNLRLGEGTGAVLAMSIVEASLKILGEMATFQSAGVSEKAKK